MDKTLIFPSSVAAARVYAEEAVMRGENVVAASSLEYDPTAADFPTWIHLPSIYDARFSEKLIEAVAAHDIARVYAPVSAVHNLLIRLVAEKRLSVSVIGEMPIARQTREHRRLMQMAGQSRSVIAQISEQRSPLTLIEVAATLRLALGIYGESNEAKIAAMMAIFADAPAGDVVEIGTLVGRSASVLAIMAQRHGTGPVLAVDPWTAGDAIQKDSSADLVAMTEAWRADRPTETFLRTPFEGFLVALLPIGRPGTFNYLALSSSDAFQAWSGERRVASTEFGETHYSGRIAVLHIDANHDYAAVQQDCAFWLPRLIRDGWLILDDYVWLHGNGPRRVGDALLLERSQEISRAFVCGNALFVKFGALEPNHPQAT